MTISAQISKAVPPRLGFVILRVGVGVLFLWAGAAKIWAPSMFFGSLLAYELPLASGLLRFVAVVFPWLEVLLGLAVLGGRWLETVYPLLVLLCLVFLAMLGQAWARGLSVECGCFGGTGSGLFASVPFAFGRALLLLLATVTLSLRNPKNFICES